MKLDRDLPIDSHAQYFERGQKILAEVMYQRGGKWGIRKRSR